MPKTLCRPISGCLPFKDAQRIEGATFAALSQPLLITSPPPATSAPSLASTTPVTNDNLPLSTPVEPATIPRCSSQLDPTLVDVLACDQELRDTRRVEDACRRESERRAKQTVKVFAWTSNGCEPTVSSFQSGFVWPFFNLSYDVLYVVGLLEASDNHLLEMYDSSGFGYWMKVDVGHIVEVREGHFVFLRLQEVKVCRGLQDHLATFRKSTPIFYGRLAHERIVPFNFHFSANCKITTKPCICLLFNG